MRVDKLTPEQVEVVAGALGRGIRHDTWDGADSWEVEIIDDGPDEWAVARTACEALSNAVGAHEALAWLYERLPETGVTLTVREHRVCINDDTWNSFFVLRIPEGMSRAEAIELAAFRAVYEVASDE